MVTVLSSDLCCTRELDVIEVGHAMVWYWMIKRELAVSPSMPDPRHVDEVHPSAVFVPYGRMEGNRGARLAFEIVWFWRVAT